MGTFYMDFVNGNDAADGSSWANAWRTFTGGPTAARVAPGDTVRIAKTPDPASLGINATFTHLSQYVTLASALTANIDLCEDVYTSDGGADVVCSTQQALCQGSYCSQVQVKAAFGTGLAAHRTITEIDLSGYQNVSFWIYSSVEVPSGYLRIDLCSDTAGTTVVDSITVNRTLKAGFKTPYLYKKGSALAASVKSVALYVITDLGGSDVNVRFDNIIACNSLHHCTMIGKSGGPYIPIRYINGTDVRLGSFDYYNYDTTNYWPAATETVGAYCCDFALSHLAASDADWLIQDSGASRWNRLTFAAGYNTGSSTQDGYTWIYPGMAHVDGGTRMTALNYNSNDYFEIQRLCLAGYPLGFYHGGGSTHITFDSCWFSGVTTPFHRNSYDQCRGMHFKGTFNFWNCAGFILPQNEHSGYAGGFLTQDKDSVMNFYSAGNLNNGHIQFGGSQIYFAGKIKINRPSSYYETGLYLYMVSEAYFNEIEIINCDYAITLNTCGNINFEKLTVTGGTRLFNYAGVMFGRVRVGRYTLVSGTPTEITRYTTPGPSPQHYSDSISFDHYKADNRWKSDHRYGTITDHITGGQDAAWAYGGTGLSMLFNPTNQNMPLIYQFLAPVASGSALKLHMQVRKTSASADCRIFAQIMGAGVSVVDEEITLTDSWAEYLSASFTPIRAGFITVVLFAYDGATTGDIGVDDIHIAAA